MKRLLLSFTLLVLSVSFAQAQDAAYYVENSSPVQVSIFDPYAIPPGLNTVRGARFNLIYGDVMNVYGLDCGLVQRVTEDMDAIQVGTVNFTGRTRPFQCALVLNHSDSMTGLQIGLVNMAGELSGLQIGLINVSRTRILPIMNWSD
jgi:hypothetical protein